MLGTTVGGCSDGNDGSSGNRSSTSIDTGTGGSRSQNRRSRSSKDELTEQQRHDLSVARTLNNIGTVHLSTGAYPSALSSFREACGMLVAVLGPNHIDVSKVHGNAGDALLGDGRYGEAVEEYGESLRIRAERSGMDHRKSKRLLHKIRVAAEAAAAKKERRQQKSDGFTLVDNVQVPPAVVEIADIDIRDMCLLTDDWNSDDEEDATGAAPLKKQIGDIKSELEVDLEFISNIGRDLELDIAREQTAISQEIRKYDTNDLQQETAQLEVVKENDPQPKSSPRATLVRSVADANAAVSDVRDRLARFRERRDASNKALDALCRVPIAAKSPVQIRNDASK